jgi:RHS repeat-associated protein
MTSRGIPFGLLLVALVPVAGSAPGPGVRALAPLEVRADGFDAPRGIAVDSDDAVFVADRKRGIVIRLKPDGTRSLVAHHLKQPFGVAVDAEARVVVSEEGAGQVVRLDARGLQVVASGLVHPRWVAVGDGGTIYVVARSGGPDTDDRRDDGEGHDRIVALAPDGRVSIFADALESVAGMAVDAHAVYVALRTPRGYTGVRRYAVRPDGQAGAASWIGRGDVVRRAGGLARDRLGALWLSAAEADVRGGRARDALVKLTERETTVFAHGLEDPHHLAFGPEGHLYVTDERPGRILRFVPPPAPTLDALPDVVPGTALALRGSASPGARIDVFVNDAERPTTATTEAGGAFSTVVVIAENTESHLEAFATAAGGEGLSSAPTLASVVHDGDGPDLAFVRPQPGAFARQRVEVEVQAQDGSSGVAQLTIDAAGRRLEPTVAPSLPAGDARALATWDTPAVPDGATTLSARAVDRAGNERAVTRVIIVDNTPPDVAILEGPSGEVSETTGEFRFGGTDNLTPPAGLAFAWRLDGGDFGVFAVEMSVTLGPLAPGPHRFEVKARDLAGNESAPAVRSFTVSPAPTITAIVPGSAMTGAAVTIVGERLGPGPVSVAFNGVPAAIRRVAASSLLTSVPPGATTGPLTVVTSRGTAARGFTVDHGQDVVLRVRPGSLRAAAGLPVTAVVTLESVGAQPFTGLAALRVQRAPAGVASTLEAAALTGAGSTTLTLTPSTIEATAGTVVVEATAVIDGVSVRREAALELESFPGQRTALGGRLTLVDDTPIVGARLTLAGTALETDEGGNFLFVDPPAGRHMLGLDVNAAGAGLPIYAIDVELAAGVATRLSTLRITPPPPPERFVPIDNAARDQVVTDDRLPGFALTLPAGISIVGWDGTPKQQIALGQLTADALPVPPPPFPARSFYQVFFGTPMGGLPSQPLPVTLPNDQDLEPGESAEIWYYDAAPLPGAAAGWRLAGEATVSADGTRAVSNPGVGIARFCGVCGIACIKRKIAGQPNIDLKGVRGGDPVDLATGLLILEKTDLALPGRIPAFVHRVHNAVDPFGRVAGFELPTGPGWTLSMDVALIEDGAQARLLVMPGNARVSFAGAGDGTFTNATAPDLAGAVLRAEANGEHRLVFRDGASWRFRSGWRARGRLGLLTGLGLLVEQRDRHGNVLIVDRDAFGAVASIVEPAGRTLTFTTALLDASDPMSVRIVGILDPLGRMVHYAYDELRRLTAVTDAAGGVVRYAYDGASLRVVSVTDPRGITYLTNEYDVFGRVIRQVQADQGIWRFSYDGPAGLHTRASLTDPGGGTTTYAFAGGRLVATIDALGQATHQSRDAGGRVTAVVDPLGRRILLDYDPRGNVTRLTDPLGHVRELSYDGTDRPRSLTQPLGTSSRLEYDAAGRLVAAVDAAGARVTFENDAHGQPVAVTDAAGSTTRLEHARTGEVVAVTDPLGRRTTLQYDAASRLIRRDDPGGGVVTIAYDALDRVIQVADAAGIVRYAYDPNGNLVSITDTLGRSVRYEYDVMDRRVAKTDALGLTERYEYDALGNVTRVVDRKGQASVYQYDRLGRRVAGRYADGRTTELTYDAGGRLVRAVSDGETVLLEYDAADRLIAETTSLGTTRYAWDALGRRTTVTPPDGTTVAYAYDPGSRLTRLARGAETVELEYDGIGRRRRVRLPGAVEADYFYDGASRLTGLTYRRAERVLGDLAYVYDDLDRRLEVAGSLASVRLPDALESAVYDAANRQLRLGDRLLGYDANGNLTTVTSPAGVQAFAWDAQNRLLSITGPSATTSMTYDALGRRSAREQDGRIAAFAYDGTDVIEDVSAEGGRSYLRGTAPDELFAVDGAAAMTDELGSLLRLVDRDGVVREALTYEPFGRTTSTAAPASRYGFTGRERDTDELYYYRARYYDARLGRFISEDPLGLAAGINPYVYAFNDPVNLADPTGLRTYVLHGVWPDRAAFEDFAVALRAADPGTRTLPWNGRMFGGVLPSTHSVGNELVRNILADLDTAPLATGEKLNLVGFSGGGLVAATLAEMLRARGVKVATVVSMGTPAQTPFTATVPSQTRLMNFVGVADPLASLRLHPRGTNYLILATHTARSYTENTALLALIKREIAR